jgi:hypothetical protein
MLMYCAHNAVIHLILSLESGKAQLPELLAPGHRPPSPAELVNQSFDLLLCSYFEQITSFDNTNNHNSNINLGTRNYSQPAQAVIMGMGFSNLDAADMRAACQVKTIPWLRPDTTKPAPSLGPEYGKAMAERIKNRLKELMQQGKMGQDGVFWY